MNAGPVPASRCVPPSLGGYRKPPYPRLARQRGEEGRVVLEIRVDARGRPSKVSVLYSSGYPRLDEAARKGLLRSRFRPARRGERAVEGRRVMAVTFRLEDP